MKTDVRAAGARARCPREKPAVRLGLTMQRHNTISAMVLAGILYLSGAALSVGQAGNATSPDKDRAPSDYRIAGTIVSKTDAHPLVRARVTIRDARDSKNVQSMITAEDGKFEFKTVGKGKYSLEGAKRGFIIAAYDQHDQFSTAIVTGAGLDTENLVLKLAPDAVITGRVLDEAGEPVRHATVNLYFDDHTEGVDQISVYHTAQTDDLGVYELTPLRPGTYFLSATAKPWYAMHGPAQRGGKSASASDVDRSLDVAYPVTYYADVTDNDSATPIPVRGGERVQVDIHLTPVPALSLRFHSPRDGNGEGTVRSGIGVPQLEQQAFDGSTPVQGGEVNQLSPGEWELSGIPAGRYNIRIPGPGTLLNGVDLSRNGEEIDTSKGEALSSVNISARMPEGMPAPKQMAIGLRGKGRTFAGFRMVDEKGNMELPDVAPGQYELLAWGSNGRYSIGQISAEGADVTGHTITIAAGASASLNVSLIAGRAEVQGMVKRGGKPFAGAMVVLVPKNPEGNRDLFRRDQSDLDGTFSLRAVIPGTYTILAIENGWDLDWSQPEVISAYAKHGRTIEVGARTSSTVRVAEAVDVVPR